jgi:hypothetical protein
VLLFGELSEKSDFVFVRWLPLIVRFKRALEVRLDVYVERLGLKLRVRRVVDAWDRFG